MAGVLAQAPYHSPAVRMGKDRDNGNGFGWVGNGRVLCEAALARPSFPGLWGTPDYLCPSKTGRLMPRSILSELVVSYKKYQLEAHLPLQTTLVIFTLRRKLNHTQ